MHVLIIPSWYRTPSLPLNGSFFREQAIALVKAGCRVSLLYWYNDAVDKAYFEELDDEGVRTVFVHYKRSPYHINFLLERHYVMEAFRRFFGTALPDIIHVHSYSATKYARMIARKYPIPYIVTEHSTAFARKLLTRQSKRTARKGFQKAQRVIAVSDGLREHLKPYCDKPIAVIPNMVSDLCWASPPAEKAATPPDPGVCFRFVSVGYLTRKKGMDMLLSAFARLRETHPSAELVICGGGEEAAALKDQAEREGSSSSVSFLGNVPREEVHRQLEQAHAFVLASRVETFGIVFIEALACGKPIVMTETDAAHTIVNSSNGLVVPIDDPAALAESMARVMDHYKNFDPAAIREDCRRRFSEEAVSQKIIEVYQDVLKETKIKK